MIEITHNFPLRQYNTFGIDVDAKYYARITSVKDIHELVRSNVFNTQSGFILGGGSNVLFTKHFDGLIIHSDIKGIEVVQENSGSVLLKAGSGVLWDDLVDYSVSHGWGGLENLSVIPGNVGAAPVQNIGAYGVEAKDTITEVHGFDLKKTEVHVYSNAECEFDYRNSIFKRTLKNRFIVTHVLFRLRKSPHTLVTHYGPVEQMLDKEQERSISVMRKLIRKIRDSKLPDVRQTGNAGSFFKNPVVPKELSEKLKLGYPDMPVYPADKSGSKLSAAWLIEKSGCKGIQMGNAGSYRNQPLVLINLGNAKGTEILRLADHIRDKVFKTFRVSLEPEVQII
ncbi:MAG: UDP-N-acetylmuramate dehydrogenase [Bacteroidales bacterium]|jgi:UDP-N-acetylmuramate dehydrogenase